MKNTIKRRSLKRKTAFLLALSMVCSLPQTMNAEAVFSNVSVSQKNNRSVLSVNKKSNADSTNSSSMTDANAVGKIDITLNLALLLKNSVEFSATLTNTYGDKMEEKFNAESSKETKISFDKLVNGSYTLEVSAPGFTTYSQNIEVSQKLYSVKLTAGLCKGYEYEKGGLHPGLLMIGDVDGNGVVDDEDKEILVNTIDGVVYEEDYATDLNFDSLTNLTDLTFLSESYKEEPKDTEAKIEEFASPEAIKPEVPDSTTCKGSLEELLVGEGSVSLAPAGGGIITKENPVEIGFDIAGGEEAVEIDGITFETGSENPVTEAEISVTYVDEDGEEHTESVPMKSGVDYLLKESKAYATLDENGNISVHLGAQIAVKKVTLKITAMQNEGNNLAEISKVEFVNGMEERIPEPELDIPENLIATAGSEQFVVNWDPCLNVKGYEVKVERDGKSETVTTVTNSTVISTFGGKELENYATYKVSVQSINGSWKSGYCKTASVTPKPTKRPDKPDNVSATGKYQSVQVGWKKMKDTQSYSVFYKARNSQDGYTEISGIKSTGYTIENLANLTEYDVYVVGHNELGSSPPSLHSIATTKDLNLADMPKYNLINRDENGKPGSTHITDVRRYGGEMVDSDLDTTDGTAWGVVDGDKSSYYKKATTYDGGWNWLGGNGLTYTFDQAYTMDTIGLLTVNTDISFMHVIWWDENGVQHNEWNGAWDYTNFAVGQSDSQGRGYYFVKLPKAITATKIQIGTGRWSSPNTVAETYFYKYDTLMDEVMSLYIDDLHTVLKDEVTQETINDLRIKINTPDEFGEINPNKAALLRELETAEKILKAQSLSKAVEIHNGITTKDTGRGFGGLNAWQPLGVSLGVGQEVTVYVGCNGKKTGDSTDLRLISTQYHSESGNVSPEGANLKVGANTFKLTKNSLGSQENGGALYIQYQGDSNSNVKYSVRVTGGTEIPMLDLYNVTDENERMEKAVAFVKKLDEYVPTIETLHNEIHKGSGNRKIDFDYDKQNCILGASDIMLDTMMISLPAQQVLAGTGSGTVEKRAERLLSSMEAMEDMMYLFYQHKGLNGSATAEINQIPKGHLNIRYQRMFSGAFMYASGNHIGIEWGSATGLINAVPVEADADGKYVSGHYFGWGIAHEIGHNINQGTYAVAEITNNYFAQLAQAKDTNEGMRFQYQNIYNKVTSGTKGDCSNIATQLGMYWQLHLAYDKGLNYKTYSNYTEQLANIFYARVDTYSRNPAAAPKPNNIALTLGNDKNQNLMRLACAASNKNVLEFFERWGKTPDSTTRAYAEQFEKETRAIFYANDDSRIYALKGGESVLGTQGSVEVIKDVSVKIGKAANKVDLRFTSADIPASDILGYEVIRCTISGGKTEETPVGFSTGSTFTDTVSTMNNRAVFYKVTLIDQYLNRSAAFTTDMVKIEHDGSMDKTNWSIRTTNLTAPAEVHDATEEMPCERETINPAQKAIDNDLSTVYTPKVSTDTAEIIIDFNQTLTTTGLKYTAGDGASVGQYEVYVMTNGEWKLTAKGTFNGSEIVYFANDDNKYISTYAATAVKLVLKGQDNRTVSIAELDVLGATGDNVDFRRTQGDKTTVIGTIGADYKYGTKATDVIPKGSIVFTGSYKGNPAYNVVILYDDKGNIVGGLDKENELVAEQIILADVPDNSNIANVSDGTWIYWIEPENVNADELPETVRVELYRVNNALTNEGQRLVSDSLFEEVPDTLPTITFGK